MSDQHNHTVREFGTTRLTLRSDLIFTPQAGGGQTHYIVEDPLNSRFFRLGKAEYTFISMLDGKTSVRDAFQRLSSLVTDHCLSESDSIELCSWLVAMDLAHTRESSKSKRLAETANTVRQQQRLTRWNPLVTRIPLAWPDRWFTTLNNYIGWLYSVPAFLGWLVLVAIGMYVVIDNRQRFAISSEGIFATDNWIWLALCWLILKLVHEMSHGIVCKRHGGTVREMGVLLILLAPMAYVDVTSSWRFRAARQRIHVALGGMYMELAIASIAAIVWSRSDAGWVSHLCYNAVLMAGVSTILFNANPLMRFDGYYVLSDLLCLPNLYSSGKQWVRYWGCRYVLGVPASLPTWTRGKGLIIRLYGIASLCWRLLICVSLTIGAAAMFHGAGVILAVMAIIMWLGVPAWQFGKYLCSRKTGESPRLPRLLAFTSLTVAIFAAVFVYLPWPGQRRAPAIVTYREDAIVRAASEGFIHEILVRQGQLVERGQLLMVLENRELTRQLADLQLAIGQSATRARQHQQRGELAAQQAERQQGDALRTQRQEKQEQVDQLSIHAPRTGRVVQRDLSTRLGTFLSEGQEVVTISSEREKELRVSISQNDVSAFAKRAGQPVQIDLPGRPLWKSRLEKVIPRATLEPPHPALSAAYGGPLPVRNVVNTTDQAPEQLELFEPRFTGVVQLNSADSKRLFAGQVGSVSYRSCDESVGVHLYHELTRWIQKRFRSQESN